VKSIIQVYGIEEVYEDFDIVENERVVTKLEPPKSNPTEEVEQSSEQTPD
jgi:hypothetical protein